MASYGNDGTVWRVIIVGAKFREKSKTAFWINFMILIFVTATQTGSAAQLCTYTCTYDCARPLLDRCCEELTSCCSNSIDASPQVWRIDTIYTNLTFSSGQRQQASLYFIDDTRPREQRALGVEYAIISLAYPSLAGEVGHTRLRHQLVDTIAIKWHLSHSRLPSQVVSQILAG